MRNRLSLVAMAALALGGTALWAQTAPVSQAAADPAAAQIEALQQRLLASQQVVATLERELADQKNRTVALEQCRTRNGRLVSIGRQLIDGYAHGYAARHNGPLQLGRRRFEFELQAMSEAIYDNHVDVPLKTIRTSTRDAEVAAPAAEAGAETGKAETGK